MEISFCSHPNTNKVIATIFGTWHDSWAVVACAKFCCNIITSNWIRVKWNCRHISIVMGKLLVKWSDLNHIENHNVTVGSGAGMMMKSHWCLFPIIGTSLKSVCLKQLWWWRWGGGGGWRWGWWWWCWWWWSWSSSPSSSPSSSTTSAPSS